MDIKRLREHFPDEESCRSFFESIIWSSGRTCPHCSSDKSWGIKGESARDGLYECGKCGHQFTVPTKTPMHSTKLPLFSWLTAMYLMTSSSKGISSVVLGRLLGTRQKTAWKLGHAIRALMAEVPTELPQLMVSSSLTKNTSADGPGSKKASSTKAAKARQNSALR